MAFEDVGVAEFFEDIDFGEQQFLQLGGLERIQFDDLDGDCLPCVM